MPRRPRPPPQPNPAPTPHVSPSHRRHPHLPLDPAPKRCSRCHPQLPLAPCRRTPTARCPPPFISLACAALCPLTSLPSLAGEGVPRLGGRAGRRRDGPRQLQQHGRREADYVEMVTLCAQPMSATTFMELALDQAKFALNNLEVPVGCVIVEDGKVISSGCNRTNATRNATKHAEMEAIDVLLQEWQSIGLDQSLVAEKFAGCDLYVTCEPCIMCASALSILGIREVYFGCGNDKFGGCGSVMSLHESLSSDDLTGSEDTRSRGFKCTGGIMAEEAVALFRNFYEQGNPNAPKPHRPVQVDQQ